PASLRTGRRRSDPSARGPGNPTVRRGGELLDLLPITDAVAIAPRRRAVGELRTLLVGLGLILLLAVFVLLPILQVVTFPPWTDYLDLAANGRWRRAAANTCRMVVLSTASATLVGFIYAFAL